MLRIARTFIAGIWICWAKAQKRIFVTNPRLKSGVSEAQLMQGFSP